MSAETAAGAAAAVTAPQPVESKEPVQAPEPSAEDAPKQQVDSFLALTIKLPHEPFETKIQASTQEQVQDLRQAVIDSSSNVYTCFHLEHNGKPVSNHGDLSEVEGLAEKPELVLVEDPYTERDARTHLLRVRDLLNLTGNKVNLVSGIDAGASVFTHVLESENTDKAAGPNAAFNKHILQTKTMAEYKFDSPGDINAIIAPVESSLPKPVRSVALSHWNPPPYNLQMQGHLLYLVVATNEGEQYHITSHVSGFFVNKSSNHKFDPFPRPDKDCSSHSLVRLFSQLSPSFSHTMEALIEKSKSIEPLSIFPLTHAVPSSPWMVPPSSVTLAIHQSDALRPQENSMTGTIDANENLRDWNEEFQSTRELPRDTVPDRIFRERLMVKLAADFVDAAVRGAVLLARGELSPLNPNEPLSTQIYVWNNIFFSYGADGIGTFAAEGGDEAARVATGKDVEGVRIVNQLDLNGLYTAGTVVVDYMGRRIVGQSIVPGIFRQRDPGEHQIDYGGVEGKDVVTTDKNFEPLLKELSRATFLKSHHVWDKEKTRHTLEASIETKGLTGTDGRKYVLDLYRTTPLDIYWLDNFWDESVVQEDGTVASKDLAKNYPHRMTTLRPELLELLFRHKTTEYLKELKEKNSASITEGETDKSEKADETGEVKKEEADDKAVDAKPTDDKPADDKETAEQTPETSESDEPPFTFELNPDVFTGQEPQTEEEAEQLKKDEQEVRDAADFLVRKEIPRFVKEYTEADSAFPVDGITLTQTFHRRGINMRYLGHVAQLCKSEESRRAKVLYTLTHQEMVSRAFKHVLARYLRGLPAVFAPACAAHLLNCLFAVEAGVTPVAEVDSQLEKLYPNVSELLTFRDATPKDLESALQNEIFYRYRFEIDRPFVQPGRQFALLREIATKTGLQLSAREYSFTAEGLKSEAEKENKKVKIQLPPNGKPNAATNGKKKKGAAASQQRNGQVAAPVATPKTVQTFHAEDVLNFVPIIKSAAPKSVLADEAFEAGRISIQQNDKELGSELLFESLSLYEQIYGILHPECARMYLQLSNIYHSLGENTGAVELARKAIIIFERTLGIDCVETIQAYMNLSLHEHSQGNPERALLFTLHALELWKLLYGLDHPDAITAISNSAIMLQAQREYHESRVWFEEALKMSIEMFERESLPSATLLYQLSQALAFERNTHAAVNKMREAYQVFKNLYGEEDARTKDAEAWLQQLTRAAVKNAKSEKMLQDAMSSGRLRTVPINPKEVEVNSGANNGAGPSKGKSAKKTAADIDELVRYIEGDGKQSQGLKKGSQNPKLRGHKGRP